MAARLDAPVLGAQSDYQGPDKWEVAVSWRYQKSHRHFVGIEEQKNRETEQSQVINKINQPEVSIRRNYSPRWSLTLGVPWLMATRSSPVRNAQGVVFDRSITSANGVGDVTLTARRWMWDPTKKPKGNLALGIGMKFPTGEDNVQDVRKAFSDTDKDGTVDLNEITRTTRTVDQSIQPGDGGIGFVLDIQSFRRMFADRLAGYFTGTYLINPDATNGVETFRSGAGEDIMSVADQYLARAGVSWFPGAGLGLSLGWRIEGVPVHDLFGSSKGFRRPGYATSIEPGISFTRGPHTVSLSVPIAQVRNRQRSVPDIDNHRNPGGDAAFADYVVLLGYFRKY